MHRGGSGDLMELEALQGADYDGQSCSLKLNKQERKVRRGQ